VGRVHICASPGEAVSRVLVSSVGQQSECGGAASRIRGVGRFRRWGQQLSTAESLSHASHSPLRGFQAVVDTALERTEAVLSNPASTATWKPHNGDCVAKKSALKSAGVSW
jgi:hypothetical protein